MWPQVSIMLASLKRCRMASTENGVAPLSAVPPNSSHLRVLHGARRAENARVLVARGRRPWNRASGGRDASHLQARCQPVAGVLLANCPRVVSKESRRGFRWGFDGVSKGIGSFLLSDTAS